MRKYLVSFSYKIELHGITHLNSEIMEFDPPRDNVQLMDWEVKIKEKYEHWTDIHIINWIKIPIF